MVPRMLRVQRRVEQLSRHLTSAPARPTIAGSDFFEIQRTSLTRGDAYRFLISACVPRPIAFISTVGAAGVRNLSPYSFFNIVSTNPPTLAFGHVTRPHLPGGMSDTLRNLTETQSCVVQLISKSFLEAANHTCGAYDYDMDEITLAGLTALRGDTVPCDRIAESAIQCECELERTHEIRNKDGVVSSTICILNVKAMHINRGVLMEDMSDVDLEKIEPVGRLGGDTYGCTAGVVDAGPGSSLSAHLVRPPPFHGKAPNPNYKPGEKAIMPFSIEANDFARFGPDDTRIGRYLTSAFVPRPSFIITTRSKSGESRMSCHSFLNGMGSDPLTLILGVQEASETYRNLESTGECVVHGMSASCFDFARQHFSKESKKVQTDEIGFRKGSGEHFTCVNESGDLERLGESPLHILCSLEKVYDIGSSRLCVLTVDTVFVHKSVYDRKGLEVQTEAFSPVSRLNLGRKFGQVANTFDLPRPNKDGSEGKLRFSK